MERQAFQRVLIPNFLTGEWISEGEIEHIDRVVEDRFSRANAATYSLGALSAFVSKRANPISYSRSVYI